MTTFRSSEGPVARAEERARRRGKGETDMMRWLKRAWLPVLGVVALLSPASAQQRPDRGAIQSEVDAYRQKAAQAARIFFDASKSDDERARAVADVTTFVDKPDIDGALAVVRNERESGRIRALALGLAANGGVDQDALLTDVLAAVKNPRAPAELRRKALDLVPVMLFSSMAAHARHGEVLAALRGLVRDPDQAIRAAALSILAAEGDDAARRQLLDGLRSKPDALLPPDVSVRLLGIHPRPDMYPVLHQVLLSPPDEATRIECIRLLGGYEPAKKDIIGILRNPAESAAVRQAALATLNANDPEGLPAHVLPVITDDRADEALRMYAILAVQQRRISRKLRLSGESEFDRAVQALAARSPSPGVKDAARRYLEVVSRKSP
jgi:hypothetical protein